MVWSLSLNQVDVCLESSLVVGVVGVVVAVVNGTWRNLGLSILAGDASHSSGYLSRHLFARPSRPLGGPRKILSGLLTWAVLCLNDLLHVSTLNIVAVVGLNDFFLPPFLFFSYVAFR